MIIIILILLIIVIYFLLTFKNFINYYVIELFKLNFNFKNKNNKYIYYSTVDENNYNKSIISKHIYNIPNNIFQIWLNNENLIPYDINLNIEQLKNNNCNWKYYLITPTKFENILNLYNDNLSLIVKEIYYNINPKYLATKSDIIRYYILYKYGGVYLDIKSNSRIPFNNLINNKKIKLYNWCEPDINFNFKKIIMNILNQTNIHKNDMKNLCNQEIIQWFLIYPKNHKILNILIYKIYDKYILYKNNKNIIQTVHAFTGPEIYTNILYQYYNKKEYEINTCFNNFIIYNNLNTNHKYYYKNCKHYTLINEKIIS